MKKVIVASKNPVKINSVKEAFERVFPGESFAYEGISAPSGVPDQPRSDEEALTGAKNRTETLSKENPDADFWIGIEAGIEKKGSEMEAFAWVVIKSKEGLIGKGKSGTFFLPLQIVELIDNGVELGHADDIVFGIKDSKLEQGAVGILTHNVISRTALYTHAVVLALIPFKNVNLYTYGKK